MLSLTDIVGQFSSRRTTLQFIAIDRRFVKLVLGATIACSALTAHADPLRHHAKSVPVKAPAAQPETIRVVGVRQPRRIETLGTSGEYVGEKTLQTAQIRNTGDLPRVLPGLHIDEAGSLLFPAISVRGVTSAQDYYHSGTTFYIDDVPVLPINAMQALENVHSVQFLKGPQSELYGQSAEGGVIDVVTRQPGPNFHASVNAGAESRYGYHANGETEGSVLKHWLYGSVSMSAQDRPGNLTNIYSNTKRLGGYSSRGGRGMLRLAPDSQPWEIDFSVDGACTYSEQNVYVAYDAIASRHVASTVPGGVGTQLTRCNHDESLRGYYHFNGWKLSAITSWQNSDYTNIFPYFSYAATQQEQWSTNTQELRLGTEGHHRIADVVSGFFHQSTNQYRQSLFAQFAPSYVPYSLTSSHNNVETFALYGNVYWHLLSNLDLGTGGRLSRDMAAIDFNSASGGQTLFAGHNTHNQNMALGNVSLDYHVVQGWHLYGRISQGYKPAGFNFAPMSPVDATFFNPERLLSYEASILHKSSTLFARFGYFYNNIRNQQVYVGPISIQTISSAGRAYTSGVEGDLNWTFLPRTSLGLSGTEVISKFRTFSAGPGQNYAGNRQPLVPSFMASGHLSTDLQSRYGKIEPTIEVSVTGPQYFDVQNHLKQPTYALLNFRTTWSPSEHYSVTVYANNVTDKLYRTYAFSSFSGPLAQINFGRTVGFDLRAAFD